MPKLEIVGRFGPYIGTTLLSQKRFFFHVDKLYAAGGKWQTLFLTIAFLDFS